MSGVVYVGKKVRGEPQPSVENAIRVDVTSGSKKMINGIPATTLSPMKLGPVRESKIFENFWQYSKVYPQLGHVIGYAGDTDEHNSKEYGESTEKWHKWRNAGFAKTVGVRTPPAVSELKRKFRAGEIPAWTPAFAELDGKRYSYLDARRGIYVPYYYAAIKDLPIIAELKKMVASGENILIIDVDGPAIVTEMNITNVLAALDNPDVPFGHGYIVAAAISGDEKIIETLLNVCRNPS